MHSNFSLLTLRFTMMRGVRCALRRMHLQRPTLALLIVGILLLNISGFGAWYGFSENFFPQNSLILDFQSKSDSQAHKALYTTLRNSPLVKSVQYVSSTQKYARLRNKRSILTAFFEREYIPVPIGSALHVQPHSPENLAGIGSELSKKHWARILTAASFLRIVEQQELFANLQKLRRSILGFSIGSIVLFLILLGVILSQTTKEKEQQMELRLLHRLGASKQFSMFSGASEKSFLFLFALLLSLPIFGIVFFSLPTLQKSIPTLLGITIVCGIALSLTVASATMHYALSTE